MRSNFPLSLLFFAATGGVFILQMIPIIGIFMMFLLAPLWSVALVNAGMMGIGVEALAGRVSRQWLLVPLLFYGGYIGFATFDHLTLASLSKSYDSQNARVKIPFEPSRQALVFEGGDGGAWFTQNYALPVAFSVSSSSAEEYRSTRMIAQEVCSGLRDFPVLRSAGVYSSWFHDGDEIRSRKMEKRFCNISLPERPSVPQVRVVRKEQAGRKWLLPLTQVTTIVTMADGQRFELHGGTASPLSWLPMPVIGCALNSSRPSWDCNWGFWRSGFTPIVSGTTRFGRDSVVLARALGLKPVAIADRRGAASENFLAKIRSADAEALNRQTANIDAMIASPLVEDPNWRTDVFAGHPEVLASRAGAIITGVERAAAVTGKDRSRARESGRILAGLLAKLPDERFTAVGPRILALYGKADDPHWLWDVEPLLRRMGDLGVSALPYLLNPRAIGYRVNDAGIEGLCRVGAAGRDAAQPHLLSMWTYSRDRFDHNRRIELYVAMRRMGITPPPLPGDEHNQFAELQSDWVDITPQSPPSVCVVRN
jgi:hypothetical protein